MVEYGGINESGISNISDDTSDNDDGYHYAGATYAQDKGIGDTRYYEVHAGSYNHWKLQTWFEDPPGWGASCTDHRPENVTYKVDHQPQGDNSRSAFRITGENPDSTSTSLNTGDLSIAFPLNKYLTANLAKIAFDPDSGFHDDYNGTNELAYWDLPMPIGSSFPTSQDGAHGVEFNVEVADGVDPDNVDTGNVHVVSTYGWAWDDCMANMYYGETQELKFDSGYLINQP